MVTLLAAAALLVPAQDSRIAVVARPEFTMSLPSGWASSRASGLGVEAALASIGAGAPMQLDAIRDLERRGVLVFLEGGPRAADDLFIDVLTVSNARGRKDMREKDLNRVRHQIERSLKATEPLNWAFETLPSGGSLHFWGGITRMVAPEVPERAAVSGWVTADPYRSREYTFIWTGQSRSLPSIQAIGSAAMISLRWNRR